MNGRARARRELVLAEWLHQEIISAVFDLGQCSRQPVVRGDDDNGDMPVQGVLPQRPADVQPGHVRCRKIDQDEVERLGCRLPQRSHAVRDRFAGMAIETEPHGHGLAKSGFVLDQQDARAG